jgi:acyl-coenzyme A synthetase/AMP-(fatty) acid ligase/DNA-binding response OmpR family regulator
MNTGQHKVLVVDDDPYILMSLEFLMKKSGYEVIIARNGTEALSAINQNIPDLILLDIMMPDVDGYAICEYIKRTPEIEHCKVVFLSAKTKEADIKRGYDLGAELYISKPFSTRSLMQQVQDLLSTSKSPNHKPAYTLEYEKSIEHKEQFWKEQARHIKWFEFPDTILTKDNDNLYRWFKGGKINMSYLCLDYHIEEGRGEQIALIYDSPVTKTIKKYSFIELRDEVAKLAGGLKKLGVNKGDTVVIYMPMIPQAVMAMLACARIGAIHSVVFGGFAPHELSIRIDDAEPKAIITASYGIEFDKKIPYKPLVDHAIMEAYHKPQKVIIYQREGMDLNLDERDIDMHELMQTSYPLTYTPVDAVDPLYVLYTSGTTGKPKGIVRDTGGYAVALKYSMKNIYNAETGDVFWAASDVGWVVGHSYIVYAPLIHGCTTIVFEGKPVRTPNAGEFWRVAAEHKVKSMFTAPTAIRAIKKEDSEGLLMKDKDLSHLKILFLAGERCDPATYHWVNDLLQKPVIDHWWQTESGWPMLGIMMGLEPFPAKAGSAGKPVPGFEVQILEDDGTVITNEEEGFVAVKLPLPPGCLPTLWNNADGYKQSYLFQFPGYYLTGDGGHKDKEGYFFIMGRIDDVINVSGHRLSTGEMEEIISRHPAIAECAVVGIADELRGQRPVGFVVMKDSHHNEELELENELVQLVRDQIGAVAYFRNAILVKRLPKTRSGKILRKTLRLMIDGANYTIPSTIDDPVILDEVKIRMQERKIGVKFQ